MSLATDILAIDDMAREPVAVPEWNMPTGLFIRTLTGAERDAFEVSISPQAEGDKPDLENVTAKMIVRTLVDASNCRVFVDAQAEALGQKNSSVLKRLGMVAMRLNPFTQKDMDLLVKNSDAGPSAGFGSDSPAT